jgi:hypothetical protein
MPPSDPATFTVMRRPHVDFSRAIKPLRQVFRRPAQALKIKKQQLLN